MEILFRKVFLMLWNSYMRVCKDLTLFSLFVCLFLFWFRLGFKVIMQNFFTGKLLQIFVQFVYNHPEILIWVIQSNKSNRMLFENYSGF